MFLSTRRRRQQAALAKWAICVALATLLLLPKVDGTGVAGLVTSLTSFGVTQAVAATQ